MISFPIAAEGRLHQLNYLTFNPINSCPTPHPLIPTETHQKTISNSSTYAPIIALFLAINPNKIKI